MSMSHGSHTGHLPASGDRKALVISGWLTGLYFIVELGIGIDLPLNFHPTATGARFLFTPVGAG